MRSWCKDLGAGNDTGAYCPKLKAVVRDRIGRSASVKPLLATLCSHALPPGA
jgi:hypothetical protein